MLPNLIMSSSDLDILRNLQNSADHDFNLNQSSTLLLLNAVSDGVTALDLAGKIIYCNKAAQDLLGYRGEELRGRQIAELFDRSNDYAPVMEPVLQGDVVSTDENRLLNKKGTPIHIILTALPIFQDDQKTVSGALMIFRDITPSVLLNLSLQEREELLRAIFNILPAGIMLQNARGRISRINKSALELLGMSDFGELRGKDFPREVWSVTDVNGEEIPFESSPFNLVLSGGEPVVNQIIRLNHKEKVRYLLVSSSPLDPGEDRGVSMAVTTFTDIDREFKTQSRLETTLSLNHQINELLQELLAKKGSRKTMEAALKGVAKLSNADCAVMGEYIPERKSVIYKYSYGFDHPLENWEAPLDKIPAAQMFKTHEPLLIPDYSTYANRIPGFEDLAYSTYLGAPIFADDEPLGVVALFRRDRNPFSDDDINNLLTLVPVLSAAMVKAINEARLADLATRDSLTGLWNRRVAFENLEKEIERCRRYDSPLSVLLMDLDFFKSINDTYGHLAGDEVLRRVAEVMKRTTRSNDLVARTGGEEFMLVMPETDLEGAVHKAEHLRTQIEALDVRYKDTPLNVTISIGCALFNAADAEETQEEFYARLDHLLYESKHNGRNCVTS